MQIKLTETERELLDAVIRRHIWYGTSLTNKEARELTNKILGEAIEPVNESVEDRWYKRAEQRMMNAVMDEPGPGNILTPKRKRYEFSYSMKQRSLDHLAKVMEDKGRNGYHLVGEFQSASTVNEHGLVISGEKYLIFEREVME